jgi:D-alanyl-D-alanine carboxypeptidase
MGPAKTGWTEASKHTYAASVTRNGRQILLTLMDTPNKWRDAEILFNWGFAQPSRATSVRSAPATTSTAVRQPALIPASNALQHGAP